jgi:ubiquinone/menaquinone biosynthesis C-methylase UbiE
MTTLGSTQSYDTALAGEGSPVDRSRFEQALREYVESVGIHPMVGILIVGGSYRDANVVYRAGFRRITLSNIEPMADAEKTSLVDAKLTLLYADLENLPFPDNSYDVVLAHEVLHHCRSPHRALLEMLRVCRKHVILMEPNDSLTMRVLIKLRFSFPYELPAVTSNNYEKGGVQNSNIPNYIYRWNKRSVYQAAAAYLPESEFALHVRQYWDFNVDKQELAKRTETRLGSIMKIFGATSFLAGLRLFQSVMNGVPWLRAQGNKFFACIDKQQTLRPWITRSGNKLAFNRSYKLRVAVRE